MKFNGNPSEALGIDYHAFSDGEKDGKKCTRYVLCNKLTQEQEQAISKYENMEVRKNGCSYRYAPEIKYDVLYVYEAEENESAEESSFESFEDEHLGIIPGDDSSEILDQLNAEVEEINQKRIEQDKINRFAQISSAINMANNLVLVYKELASNEKENSDLFEKLAGEVVNQASQLQLLLQENQSIPDEATIVATEEIEEEPQSTEDGDLYDKLLNSNEWKAMVQKAAEYGVKNYGGNKADFIIDLSVGEDGLFNLLEGYSSITEEVYDKWIEVLNNPSKVEELVKIFMDSSETGDYEDYGNKINSFFEENGLNIGLIDF